MRKHFWCRVCASGRLSCGAGRMKKAGLWLLYLILYIFWNKLVLECTYNHFCKTFEVNYVKLGKKNLIFLKKGKNSKITGMAQGSLENSLDIE